MRLRVKIIVIPSTAFVFHVFPTMASMFGPNVPTRPLVMALNVTSREEKALLVPISPISKGLIRVPIVQKTVHI